MDKLYYAGIGARDTPPEALKLLHGIAMYLGRNGAVLRSGAAHGADVAFEAGCDLVKGEKQIFLPWKGYNNHKSNYYNNSSPKVIAIAKSCHPNWDNLSNGVKLLMLRNVRIIVGNNDILSEFVICWTKSGKDEGGTGMGIRLARKYNIPVFNFGGNIKRETINSMAKEIEALSQRKLHV